MAHKINRGLNAIKQLCVVSLFAFAQIMEAVLQLDFFFFCEHKNISDDLFPMNSDSKTLDKSPTFLIL
jgi:hypothetical protein